MGRAWAARGTGGGGEDIPPFRASRIKTGLIALAAILACGLTVYPLVFAGSLVGLAGLLGGFGLVCLTLGLLLRAGYALAAGLLTLAAEYVLIEVLGRVPALSVVGYSAGLIVLAEILLWLRQLPSAAQVDVAVVVRWSRGVAVIAAAAVVLAVAVLAVAGLWTPGPISGAIAGSAAAAALLALPWLLLRRRSTGRAGVEE